MDIKAKIEEIIQKLTKDPSLMDKFKADPIAAIKELVGAEATQEQLNELVSGVSAKIGSAKSEGIVEEVKEKVEELGEKLSGFFHKKD